MDSQKRFYRRSFFIILVFMIAAGALTAAGLYYGIDALITMMADPTGARLVLPGVPSEIQLGTLPGIRDGLMLLKTSWVSLGGPAVVSAFLILGLILWFFLRTAGGGITADTVGTGACAKQDSDGKKDDPALQRLARERQRRMFLHFMSVLQREGRLLDFFAEDLSLYEDDQIGAAVRSIHEDCKNAVDKYIAPGPVMQEEEGDAVEIQPGFDPEAVRLTGNVTGEPPFKGVLRHRGWRAGKKEIPRLSDVNDAGIIVPAEVEVE